MDPEIHADNTPAAKLERWRPLNLIMVAGAVYWLVDYFIAQGTFALELNVVNLIFFTLGLALARSLREAGAEVLVCGRRVAPLEATRAEGFEAIQANIAETGQVNQH